MPIYTLRTGVKNHPEETVNQLEMDFFTKSGITRSNALKVIENNPQAMSVIVKPGNAYLRTQSSGCYRIRSTTDIVIADIEGTSTYDRYTSIVIYADLGTQVIGTDLETAGGIGIVKIITINGIPSTSPVPPSETDIKNSVVGNFPYLVLANVMIRANTTSITNENIVNVAEIVKINEEIFTTSKNSTPKPLKAIDTESAKLITHSNNEVWLNFYFNFSKNNNVVITAESGDYFRLHLSNSASEEVVVTFTSSVSDDTVKIVGGESDTSVKLPAGKTADIYFDKFDKKITGHIEVEE